jgi:diguanylate cyclase (GGDEF)-like protein
VSPGPTRTDRLTQLFNQRAALEAISAEAARARRHNGNFALVMASVDHLHHLVAHHGPEKGTWVLTTVANLLRRFVRTEDHVARWDDGQFLLLLPDADLDGAGSAANRIRSEVERSLFHHDEERIHFTLSMGVLAGDGATDPDAVGQLLEQALNDARRAGGNRVVKIS